MTTKLCKHSLAVEVICIRIFPNVILFGLLYIIYDSIEDTRDTVNFIIALIGYLCYFYWVVRRFRAGKLILQLEEEGFYYNYLTSGLVSNLHFVSWADVLEVRWISGGGGPTSLDFTEIILRSNDSLFKPAYGWLKVRDSQRVSLIFCSPMVFFNGIAWEECINEYLDRFNEQLNEKSIE